MYQNVFGTREAPGFRFYMLSYAQGYQNKGKIIHNGVSHGWRLTKIVFQAQNHHNLFLKFQNILG